MSWDVVIMDFGDYACVEDIPQDYQPEPIGPRAQVEQCISHLYPAADFSDPPHGRLSTEAGSVEFFFGEDDPVKSVVLSIRGGDDLVAVVHAVAEVLGCRAYDCSSGDFLVPGQPATGFAEWRAYRDQVLRQDKPDNE